MRYLFPKFIGDITTGSSKRLDSLVIGYIRKWLEAGCGPQSYRVFSTLALSMPPSSCREMWPLRGTGKGPLDFDLLVTKRDPKEDPLYGGMYHGIGSAPMFIQFFGPEQSGECMEMFPAATDRAYGNAPSWKAANPDERIKLRVLTRELGLLPEDCMSIIHRTICVGHIDQITPRGGEGALVNFVILTSEELVKITKPVSWLPIVEIPKRQDFIEHQKPRLAMITDYLVEHPQ